MHCPTCCGKSLVQISKICRHIDDRRCEPPPSSEAVREFARLAYLESVELFGPIGRGGYCTGRFDAVDEPYASVAVRGELPQFSERPVTPSPYAVERFGEVRPPHCPSGYRCRARWWVGGPDVDPEPGLGEAHRSGESRHAGADYQGVEVAAIHDLTVRH